MWLFYWGMTDRQIELLLADQPIIVYDNATDKTKKKGKRGPSDNVKSSEGDVMMAAAKFAQKHGVNGDGKVSLDLKKIFIDKHKEQNDTP